MIGKAILLLALNAAYFSLVVLGKVSADGLVSILVSQISAIAGFHAGKGKQ